MAMKWISSRVLVYSLLLYSIESANGQQIVLDGNELSTCTILDLHLPGCVSFKHNDTYNAQINSYWATNQGQIYSSCRVTPRNTSDVQQILSIISSTETHFAVKSGGHSVVENTSNIKDGIVIDLELLNTIAVNKAAEYVDIGVGARWKDVYALLDGSGFGVTGARAGSVGVGGYLLGGGLSIYQGAQGWACDSALLFEVVLANGTCLEVSHERHADLFKALKGSATNFGVVTRARLRLIPHNPDIEVINLSYQVEQLSDLADAVVRYNVEAAQDPLATVGISVGGTMTWRALSISVFMTHPDSVRASPVLNHFFNIPHAVGMELRMSQLEMAMLYDEMNPPGYRQLRTTMTIHNKADVLATNESELEGLFTQLVAISDSNLQLGLLIQPLTLPHLHTSKLHGGNILGLENEISPLLLLSFELRHSDVEDDSAITSLGFNFMANIERQAAAKKILHAYRYLNYASASPDAFGHARSNKDFWAWLMGVKNLYDPQNVFGRQMQHPFKILME